MNNMTPIDWAIRPFKNYATFTGRAPRAEFWWFTLFVMIIYLVVMFVVGAFAAGLASANPVTAIVTGSFGFSTIVVTLLWLAMFIPSLAVQIRRLHDTNRSGWWLAAFWVLYVIYTVFMVKAGVGAAVAPGTTPNLGAMAGMGVLAIVMLIASIVLLVFFCLRGTVGPNRYGADPYGGEAGEAYA